MRESERARERESERAREREREREEERGEGREERTANTVRIFRTTGPTNVCSKLAFGIRYGQG